MDSEVRYARNGGVNIAFQVVGKGSLDLVFVPGFVSHLTAAWEEPRLSRFLRRLASFSRLIIFDKRGCGMSDPVTTAPTAAERLNDLRAVMDAAGSERAALFGTSEGGGACILFADAYPDRATALVTFGSFAKALRSADYPYGWSGAEFERILTELESTWLEGAEMRNPSLRGDDKYREWFVRFLRLAASPGMLHDLMTMNAHTDTRPVLARLHLPALVLHRTGDPWVTVEHGRYLASHIPGARLVELPGVDHWPWIGETDALLDEVELFLTGALPRAAKRAALGPEALTKREREVVRLAVEGYSAPQIGRLLFISERTVETHLASAYAKLGVESKLELVRRAAELQV